MINIHCRHANILIKVVSMHVNIGPNPNNQIWLGD